MPDLLIRGGLVIDGRGHPGFHAAIAVDDERVRVLLGDTDGIYSAFSGYRALFRKRPHAGEAACAWDWLAAAIALSASIAQFALGVARLNETWTRISTIAIVLGLLGVALAARDRVRPLKQRLRLP